MSYAEIGNWIENIVGGTLVGIAVVIVGVITFIVMLIDYLVGSLAYYKVLKLMNYVHPVAAWIPIWGEFAIADCLDVNSYNEVSPLEGIDKKTFRWFNILSRLTLYIPALGAVLTFLINLYGYSVTYTSIISTLNRESIISKSRRIWGILSSLFPIIFYIQVFCVDGNAYRMSKSNSF